MSLRDGLVAFWDMREGGSSGLVMKDSGPYQADMTFGSSGWSDSPWGPCMDTLNATVFTASATGLVTANDFVSGVSMAAWIYPTSTPSGSIDGSQIISIGGYILLTYIGLPAKIGCEVTGSGATVAGSTTITANTDWVFAGFTCSPGTSNNRLTIYVNGEVDGTGTQSITSTVSGRAMSLGYHTTLNTAKYPGKIAFPAIWNRELSQSEFRQLYRNPWSLPGRAPRLAPLTRRYGCHPS